MKETSLEKEINALEVRKVAIAKRALKGIAISALCLSFLSFAFAIGYAGTFLLFR